MTQICGDQVAPAHRQWRKLVETEPERGCQMGLPLAAHTAARSKVQPLPPADFSLQITDLMCESVSPMQRMAPALKCAVREARNPWPPRNPAAPQCPEVLKRTATHACTARAAPNALHTQCKRST